MLLLQPLPLVSHHPGEDRRDARECKRFESGGSFFSTAAIMSVLATGKEVGMAKGVVSIVVERCKACGFCVEFCPTKVLALSSAFNSKGYHPPHVVNAEKCSGCDLCGMYCPDFAIFGRRVNEAKEAKEAVDAR